MRMMMKECNFDCRGLCALCSQKNGYKGEEEC